MKNTAPFYIDSSFPGGNIVVEKVENDVVSLRQDLRDTEGYWFYWSFRIRGASGLTVRFSFTYGNVIGVRGPAISRDHGCSWQWLGMEHVKDASFQYSFADNEDDVRFSFAMPYQDHQLQDFLKQFYDNPRFKVGELCQTRQGRVVESIHVGCLDRDPAYRVLLTCRHHCCEMMPNYMLEGIVKEVLSESSLGKWLCDNVEFLVIPFMDKDGVEDGDQGKNRKPHDHGQDYHGDSIYPSVAAVKAAIPQWLAGKPLLGFDLHCPGARGVYNEVVLCPDRLRDKDNWRKVEIFFNVLEEVQQGPLSFRIAESLRFVSWDGSVPVPTVPRGATEWMRTLPNVRFASVIELPYANADNQEVNQETAREFGHDMARALHMYLERQTQ